jgi:hypothetical protein
MNTISLRMQRGWGAVFYQLCARIGTEKQQCEVQPLAGLEMEFRQAQIESIRAALEDVGSTQVRRLDGVELPIPNSHLLENRVAT